VERRRGARRRGGDRRSAAGGAWAGVAKTGWILVLGAAVLQFALVASAWRTPPD
jgi:hypothetical protein